MNIDFFFLVLKRYMELTIIFTLFSIARTWKMDLKGISFVADCSNRLRLGPVGLFVNAPETF